MYIADEAFFTGTAAEVLPIQSLDGRTIGGGSRGPITEKIQSAYFDQVRGNRSVNEEWHSSEVKLLIVAPAWVGDMVMAHSLIQSLSRRPIAKTHRCVSTPSYSPIASRMKEVRKTYKFDVGHGRLGLSARMKAAALLKEESYDEAYVLPNSWKSALVPFLARIKKRVGWVGEMRYGILNDVNRSKKALL